jgi:hypothetical protein
MPVLGAVAAKKPRDLLLGQLIDRDATSTDKSGAKLCGQDLDHHRPHQASLNDGESAEFS